MGKKIWLVKYVAGNPEMFTRIRCSGPYSKREAVDTYNAICDRWRKWIEHSETGDRLIEDGIESAWPKSTSLP